MEIEDLKEEGILKSESVDYLKTKIDLLSATLVLTRKRIILKANKTGINGFGLLAAFLKSKAERSNIIFNLRNEEVLFLSRIKQGLQANVLEITDRYDNRYRMIVNNCQEWEEAMNRSALYRFQAN